MKVVCIDAGMRNYSWTDPKAPELIEGAIYDVIEGKGWHRITNDWVDCYYIVGHPDFGFAKDRFIPLSDISETELIKERETVNA